MEKEMTSKLLIARRKGKSNFGILLEQWLKLNKIPYIKHPHYIKWRKQS